MTAPLFPSLIGQGWSVHKKPKWDTRIAPHVTGREARAGKYATPMWDFELTFDGLDMTATGTYGGLGAESMQTLAGFFLECQGRANPFVYVDPTDNLVTGGAIGTGDGVTTVFTFTRNLGGYFAEPVGALVSVSSVYLNGARVLSGWGAAQPNVLTFGVPPPAGVVITADFKFGFACRFSEDIEDFEEFMSMLSGVKTLTFQSVRDIVPLQITGLRIIVIRFPIGPGEFCAPSDWNNNYNRIYAIGGGAGGGYAGGAGGGGGAFTYRDNVVLATGQCVPIVVGAGGAPRTTPGTGSFYGSPGVATTFGNPTDPYYIYAEFGTGGGAGQADHCTPGLGVAQSGGFGQATIHINQRTGGGGGGGAGGPNGPGGNGGQAIDANPGGCGGGAADGGVGANPSTTVGGSPGGAAFDGTPGGVGGAPSAPGGSGVNGSGGGGGGPGPGGIGGGMGGAASTERLWFADDGVWYGPGSGGGGGGAGGGVGAPGAPLGGGGGAGGDTNLGFGGPSGTQSPGGEGAPGGHVIIYLALETSG
jgi:hypothetical protein